MSKLNQEYFKAREKHEQELSSKKWYYVIPILFALAGVMVTAINKINEVGEVRAGDELKKISTSLLSAQKTDTTTVVKLENLGLTVELPEGLKYNYSKQANMLTAISQDSLGLGYMIGEVPQHMRKKNIKEVWISGIKAKDPNVSFRDTLDFSIVETSLNGIEYKGLLKFKDINNKQLVYNSSVVKGQFSKYEPQMNKIFESIKTE